jgi:type IV secretory pathway TrbD component
MHGGEVDKVIFFSSLASVSRFVVLFWLGAVLKLPLWQNFTKN